MFKVKIDEKGSVAIMDESVNEKVRKELKKVLSVFKNCKVFVEITKDGKLKRINKMCPNPNCTLELKNQKDKMKRLKKKLPI